MKHEWPASPHPEQAETLPKIYKITFDESHFGEREISPDAISYQRMMGSSWLPQPLLKWWKDICLKSGLRPNNRRLSKISYLLLEIARNAFENVGSGEIEVCFSPKKITVSVTDRGQGLEDPQEAVLLGHGLDEVRTYADEFVIETDGKKYSKPKKRSEMLTETADTDIRQGTKITFVKNFGS